MCVVLRQDIFRMCDTVDALRSQVSADAEAAARQLVEELQPTYISSEYQEWAERLIQCIAYLITEREAQIEKLKDLIVHIHVHSGYPDCGYLQMTTAQKQLHDQVWGEAVAKEDALGQARKE